MSGDIYPWGNESSSCENVAMWDCPGTTQSVGTYVASVSPYGAYDMSGNVYEWVLDWFGELYYSATPMDGWSNPLGPTSSEDNYKVVKGGAYALGDSSPNILRASKRGRTGINSRENYYGFRCAQDVD